MSEQKRARTGRILIVEDEGIVAADIERCLEDAGFEVTAVAASAGDAIQAVATTSPDLVLMDVTIQGSVDGIQAGSEINRRFGVPIVYLTAHGDRDTIERAKKTSPLAFLLKPFKSVELVNAVEIALNRSESEKESRARERFFAAAIGSIGDAVVTADAHGRARFLNCAAERLTGYRHEDAIGRPVLALLQIEEAPDSGAIEDFLALLGLSQPSEIAAKTEYRIRAAGGEVRIVRVRATSIGTDGSGPVRLLVVEDITERKRVEKSLIASEERFRRLYEAPLLGIISADGDRILEANHFFLQMTGYSRQELHAGLLTWRDLIPAEHRDGERKQREQLLATGSWGPVEEEYLKKDGTRIPVLTGATLLQRDPPGWLSFVLDLAERKELERKLFEKQKLESIGLLAGGIAHDFNNLLTGIMGNASLASVMVPAGSEASQVMQDVVKIGERAAQLTRQMLAYAGKGRFLIRPVNLSDLVAELVDLIQPSISRKVAIHLELEHGLPAIEADAGQIQQVVMNLILNAAEAIGESAGLVAVRTGIEAIEPGGAAGKDAEPGTYVLLEVRDTGCGMDEATERRIFDPFFTTKFTGRGLGLAAVAGVVRAHKGAIDVKSTPGKGSIFTVRFPAASQPGDAAGPHRPSATKENRHNGAGTVLVVDDEDMIRKVAKAALQGQGFTVLCAENGPAAIEVFSREAHRVRLVLLDLSMPGMSGHEVLRELRQVRRDVRVVVSSGYSEDEMHRLFQGESISAFLQKPYTSAVLAGIVKVALNGSN